MKKIAILTWIFYPNFGSVLQAYALGKYLKNLGHEIKYINYFPNTPFPKSTVEKLTNYDEIKSKFYTLLKNKNFSVDKDIIKRKDIFKNFINKKFSLTEICETNSQLAALCKDFDVIICGSDQIWSPLIYDEKFYLSFAENKSVKKIAYAPSFGTDNIKNISIRQKIKEHINNIDFLSVREKSGIEIIKALNEKNVSVVSDPTMLLSKEEWIDFSESYETGKPYLLIYFLGNNSYYDKYISEAKKIGYNIIIIPAKSCDYKNKIHIADNLTPEQFVYLFSNAKCVLTDSYHGTLFSIKFNKPFATLARFSEKSNINQNERLHDLLQITGLNDRYFQKFNITAFNKLNEDYIIAENFYDRIEKSKKYLINAIDSLKNKKDDIFKVTENCSGCGICQKVCPQKAISVEFNNLGFYESKIDNNLCIKCGLCQKVCGFNKQTEKLKSNVYAARTKNNNLLMKVSSGGFASCLSEYLLKNDYKVIGCAYNYSENKAEHIIIDNIDSLDKLYGSKYLQSNVSDVLNKINFNNKYLFIGTPCQVASLNNLLNMKNIRNNFILVDLICHGVPTYNLWNKYIKYIQKNYLNNEKILELSFRKKTHTNSNKNMNMYFKTSNKEIYINQSKDIFLNFFCLGIAYNKSCYNCNFRLNSAADFRIGDFWGDKYSKKAGTSLVIANTEKAISILKEMNNINLLQEEFNNYLLHQQIKNINPINDYNNIIDELGNSKINITDIHKKYVKKYYILDPFKNIIRR